MKKHSAGVLVQFSHCFFEESLFGQERKTKATTEMVYTNSTEDECDPISPQAKNEEYSESPVAGKYYQETWIIRSVHCFNTLDKGRIFNWYKTD